MATALSETILIEDVEVPTGHLIGGKRIWAGEPYEVISPIDNARLGDIPDGGADEAAAAVSAAAEAFPAWAALGPEGRAPLLKRFAELIVENMPRFHLVDCYDHGSLKAGMRRKTGAMPRAAYNISFFADWARQLGRHEIEGPQVNNSVRYDPSGVSALIVPWNAPLMLGTWKIGPALAAGNTVVVKPPEFAPLSLSLLGDLAGEAGLPDGVLNILHGRGATAGDALVRDPRVSRISFTGSPATAKVISAAAAANLTPLSLELGGKSPFIVCADADLDSAAKNISVQFMNAGQICLAGTRLLVEESVADELVTKIKANVEQTPVGDPRLPETRIGPLIHPSHTAKVTGLVERALAEGAQPVMGGGPHPAGDNFFEPTILTNVAQDSEIVQTEVFGPVLTLQTWTDEREMIALANDTAYGLAAMVFSSNEEKAERIGSQTVAGTVWTNCFYVRDLEAPFGGSKLSGVGREGGTWSFDFFCDVKNIATKHNSFTS